MKRLCVFAHYDKDNIIDDYVLYYLKELKTVCDDIIFVSDNNLPESELLKLNEITHHRLAQEHGEYDFGSYKRGFLYSLKSEFIYDELVFANDSCYGPFYPFEPIFNKMQKNNCDYWGLTKNSYGVCLDNNHYKLPSRVPHLQSYFLVFRASVFKNQKFIDFISSIKKEEDKRNVILNYEIGLSRFLKKNGYKDGVFIDRYRFVQNATIYKWDKLIKKYGFPFIKTSNIKNGHYLIGEIKGWQDLISKHSDYPLYLIEKNFERLKDLQENRYDNENLYRKIRYNILINLPAEIRFIVIHIEKFSYKVLNTIFFNKLKKF